MEQKIKSRTEQRLLTQHRRFGALAERIEIQSEEDLARINFQLKERLEKLDSYKAEFSKKEEKLNKARELLKNEKAAKVKAYENLKVERQLRRKAEAKLKEEIAVNREFVSEELYSAAEKLKELLENAKGGILDIQDFAVLDIQNFINQLPFKKDVYWINESDKNGKRGKIIPGKKAGFTPALSREDVQLSITEIVKSYITTSMNSIDPGKELTDYGIESRMIIQINFELEREFNIKIPTHTFFKNNSLQALTDFIYNRLNSTGTDKPSLNDSVSPPAEDKPEDISELINSFSSEEIDKLYDQVRRKYIEKSDYILI